MYNEVLLVYAACIFCTVHSKVKKIMKKIKLLLYKYSLKKKYKGCIIKRFILNILFKEFRF